MQAAVKAGHAGFNDKMYSPLKAGSTERTSAFAGAASSARSRMKAHWRLGSLEGLASPKSEGTDCKPTK